MSDTHIEEALASLDRHWDQLIVLSRQHGNVSIMWLDDYYARLVNELCTRGLERRLVFKTGERHE